MEKKFLEDYNGEYWTQEKIDEWEISDDARELANSLNSYGITLKKYTQKELYDYWLNLTKE